MRLGEGDKLKGACPRQRRNLKLLKLLAPHRGERSGEGDNLNTASVLGD